MASRASGYGKPARSRGLIEKQFPEQQHEVKRCEAILGNVKRSEGAGSEISGLESQRVGFHNTDIQHCAFFCGIKCSHVNEVGKVAFGRTERGFCVRSSVLRGSVVVSVPSRQDSCC